MAIAVVMPRMGYDMTHGTVVRWLKQAGDRVELREPIAEIETDKAIVELEAQRAGSLISILTPEGATMAVGGVIAYVGQPGESVPSGAAAAERATGAEEPCEGIEPRLPEHDAAAARPERLRASPIARRLADEHGVDLASVTGTGPEARITKEDVLDATQATTAAPPQPAAPAPRGMRNGFAPRVPGHDGLIELDRMGQAVARRTQATMAEVPHFYVTVRIDMTAAMELRRVLNRVSHVTVNDMVLKACAMAVVKYPVFNSTFEGDHLQVQPHVNMGIAIALPDGLIVPAVLHCEEKSLSEIAEGARDVAKRGRNGTLRQEEYTGTFSVSNLGMFDIDSFTAIIVAPQVTVLAVGAARATPVVVHSEVVVRQMMAATLSIDHRAAAGAEAAQLTSEIKRLLEEPELLTG